MYCKFTSINLRSSALRFGESTHKDAQVIFSEVFTGELCLLRRRVSHAGRADGDNGGSARNVGG